MVRTVVLSNNVIAYSLSTPGTVFKRPPSADGVEDGSIGKEDGKDTRPTKVGVVMPFVPSSALGKGEPDGVCLSLGHCSVPWRYINNARMAMLTKT